MYAHRITYEPVISCKPFTQTIHNEGNPTKENTLYYKQPLKPQIETHQYKERERANLDLSRLIGSEGEGREKGVDREEDKLKRVVSL